MATPEKKRFLISGGGTGGHIFPALSIADGLRSAHPGCVIEFVGAIGKMEMQRVPDAGYVIHGLPILGLNRQRILANFRIPFKLIQSFGKSRKLLKRFQPDVVIGTGGFASGPLLYMAQRMGIPTVIQEQNSYPGITNKWLGKKAKAICVAYDGMGEYFPKKKVHLTGNPVRSGLISPHTDRDAALARFGIPSDAMTLLVLGGSLGARKVNEAIEALITFVKKKKIHVLWQCGKLYYDDLAARYQKEDIIHLHPFIAEMDKAYTAADVIISRSGAGTLSELALVKKPVVLIPSPNVAEDHQTKNAMAFVMKNAAVLVRENEIDVVLESELESLFGNDARRRNLGGMIGQLARPRATEDIITIINQIVP